MKSSKSLMSIYIFLLLSCFTTGNCCDQINSLIPQTDRPRYSAASLSVYSRFTEGTDIRVPFINSLSVNFFTSSIKHHCLCHSDCGINLHPAASLKLINLPFGLSFLFFQIFAFLMVKIPLFSIVK